jgi:DNA-binding response OmpR family regulator
MSRHILVVEDQEDNRQILRDLLGNAGFELTEAENGEEAIIMEVGRGGSSVIGLQLEVARSPYNWYY